jgi:hypothetical protein
VAEERCPCPRASGPPRGVSGCGGRCATLSAAGFDPVPRQAGTRDRQFTRELRALQLGTEPGPRCWPVLATFRDGRAVW